MNNNNAADDAIANEKGTVEHTDIKNNHATSENVTAADTARAISIDDIRDSKKTEFASDINNVASLGLENAAELERMVVRRLDMFMLPQMWILYMFNYLNRTNIAQARLNTFDEDLGLVDGDYQVCVLLRKASVVGLNTLKLQLTIFTRQPSPS